MSHNSSFIIVGLGNPGSEYENTRHNAGRVVVRRFAEMHGFPEFAYDKKTDALLSEGEVGGTRVILLLPETFMNNSGNSLKKRQATRPNDLSRSVGRASDKRQDNLIVVHDDLDIPLGSLRIAYARSAAGHKGVQSIIDALGTNDFTRVRIGISPVDESGEIRKPHGEEIDRFVLKKFTTDERAMADDALKGARDALVMILTEGREKAMNVFH